MAIKVANETERQRLEGFLDHVHNDLRDVLMLYDNDPGTYEYIINTMERIHKCKDVIKVAEGAPDRCEVIRKIGFSIAETAKLFSIQETSVKMIRE